jgi:hypothetical protein
MKQKYLFIGGKADGHMIEANYDYWRVPYIVRDSEIVFCENDGCRPCDRTFDVETYRKIKWESGDIIFQFFALESLSNSEVMSIILNNYKPKQEVRENKLISEMKFLLNECISMLNSDYPYITMWSDGNMISKHILKIHKFLNLNKN